MIESNKDGIFLFFFALYCCLNLFSSWFIFFSGAAGEHVHVCLYVEKAGILYSHFHFNVMVKNNAEFYLFLFSFCRSLFVFAAIASQ
jgi:hypothetical protein